MLNGAPPCTKALQPVRQTELLQQNNRGKPESQEPAIPDTKCGLHPLSMLPEKRPGADWPLRPPMYSQINPEVVLITSRWTNDDIMVKGLFFNKFISSTILDYQKLWMVNTMMDMEATDNSERIKRMLKVDRKK